MQPERHNANRQPASHSDGEHSSYECDAFEARLHELLDARRTPREDEQLADFGELSFEQRELLAGQQLMLDGLDLLEVPPLPDDFAQRTVAVALAGPPTPSDAAKARQESPGRRLGSRWRYVAYSLSAAALALLLLIPLRSWLDSPPNAPVAVENAGGDEQDGPTDSRDGDVTTGGMVADGDATTTVPDETPATSNVARSHDSPEEPGQLADGSPRAPNDTTAAHDQTGSGELAPEERLKGKSQEQQYDEILAAIQKWRQKLPAATEEEDLFALLDDVGLRPVADSVGGAINVLRRNLPPSGKDDHLEKPQAGAWRLDRAYTLS